MIDQIEKTASYQRGVFDIFVNVYSFYSPINARPMSIRVVEDVTRVSIAGRTFVFMITPTSSRGEKSFPRFEILVMFSVFSPT
jgi:hypothetical protein